LQLHQNKLSLYIIIVYEIEMNAIPIAQEARMEYGSVKKKEIFFKLLMPAIEYVHAKSAFSC